MKVLFVHDGPILCNEAQNVFYGVHYRDEIIERYSFFGDKVSFLMRHKVVSDEDGKKYTKISHPAFRFISVPNFKSISTMALKAKAEDIIENSVKSHDIILLRLPSANGVLAYKYAKRFNKPIFVEVVACVYDALWNYDWRGKLLAGHKMKKYKNIIMNSSHVLYVTQNFLQERYPSKGKSIGCSDVLIKKMDESVIEQRLHNQENRKSLTLGTVAAIDVPYKGQAEVIKAIAELKKQNILVRYKIVGQGSPKRLNNIIKTCGVEDLVDIVGPIKHDEVFKFIDGLDVYVQPSKTEGLPRAVIEALSRGCPSIGSRAGGIPELIQPELLFNPKSTSEIVEVIKKISNKDLQKRISKENFEKAKEYQFEIINERRKSFYREFKDDYNLI
ncbi:hypothetical protein GCM10007424_10100 [Flavobacterium suaedae]|uniref:Glycosyl transferase family 1 domain-containing protein n=1 Tax=Flavobacterium suaedae TaxID=1767027 RepID=A0ABQ1JMK0_9FLAO|nr:glycosyltransferase family 4 protein [Flavobacterium suaedae]GGB72090.1 hypothetical protein GCM10007424_10100 [Flavobacterium suaedae]